jgi:hypothetical protein
VEYCVIVDTVAVRTGLDRASALSEAQVLANNVPTRDVRVERCDGEGESVVVPARPERYTAVWRGAVDIPVLVRPDGAVWPYDRLARQYVPAHLVNLTAEEEEQARTWARSDLTSTDQAQRYQPDLWLQRAFGPQRPR